jgi:hypothetical protein
MATLEAQRLLVVRHSGGDTRVAAAESLNMSDQRIFYYEVYENQFDEQRKIWQRSEGDTSFNPK